MEIVIAALVALLVGAGLAAVVTRSRYAVRSASLATERDLLREQVVDLQASLGEDQQTAAALAPMRDALGRVEEQVRTLERDRSEQFGSIGERLAEVSATTAALRSQTAPLTGSLSSSGVRGTWGEVQLRRVLEHAGMLSRCDFDEQVTAVGRHEKRVRPDVVVRLPGSKCVVVDAKAPMTGFLKAQDDGTTGEERRALLAHHARSLRTHVDDLAGKAYWSAFSTTPEMVVCFVPGDAILAGALAAEPELYDDAQSRKVVLASPATLLALLRTVAFTWQQDALTSSARELLKLGTDLHTRLGTLGGHATRMGTSLQRAVEAYNALVGTLESRVLVTARRMRDLDLVEEDLGELTPVETAPRPLTAPELLDAVAQQRPELNLTPPDTSPRARGQQGA